MPYDPNKPYANNSFAAAGVFFNRELYKTKSYPDQQPWQIKPLDLWEKHGLYGRINTLGDAIEPQGWELKKVPSTKSGKVFVFNFVADAFEDLRSYLIKSGFQNRIDTTNTEYYDLQPERGWQDLNVQFNNYTGLLYDAFMSFASNKQIDEKITDFASFLKIFSILVQRITPQFMFTKTGFSVSGMSDPLCSGLMLELVKENHADDKVKYEKYIQDVNFSYFSDAAKKFGFAIDKNAPWRIIADVASAPMQKYMDPYQLSIDNLFEVGYNDVYKTDIPIMKNTLLAFYNNYVTERPQVFIHKPSQTDKGVLSKTLLKRIKINGIDAQEFDEAYWLKYYTFVRAKELGRPWRQVTFNRLIKTAQQLNTFRGYDMALDFLTRRLRGKPLELLSLTSDDPNATIKFDFLNKSYFQPFRLF